MMRVQSSSGLRPSFVLRAIVRWLCGVSFMIYGFAKLNGAQFTVLDSQLATPLGDADPFWLAWYFFGYSDLYKGFIALTEIVGGVLIVLPRTALLGALVLLPTIVNAVLVGFAFQIATGGKLAAIVLAGAVLYVILPHARRLLDAALLDHESTRTGLAAAACGAVAAGILAFLATYWIANYNNRRPTAIDGTWEVVGDRTAGISRAYFERNRAYMVVFMNEDGALDRRHFEITDGEIRIWNQWLSKGDLVAQGRLTEQDLMELRFEAGPRTTLRRRFGPGLSAAPRATR